MAGTRLNRRRFMQAALSQVVALAVLPSLACGGETDRDRGDRKNGNGGKPGEETSADRDEVLRSHFGDPLMDEARRLGKFYLETEADGAGAADIDRILSGTLNLIEESPSDEAALDALRQAIRTDFVDRNLVHLGGWTFSLTEAQLCALAYVHA